MRSQTIQCTETKCLVTYLLNKSQIKSRSRIGGYIHSHHWTFGCFQESHGESLSLYHVSIQTWPQSWYSVSLDGLRMRQKSCKNSAIHRGLIAFMFRKLECRSFSVVNRSLLISQRQNASSLRKCTVLMTRRDSCKKKEKLKRSVIDLKLILMTLILGTGEVWLQTRKIDLIFNYH